MITEEKIISYFSYNGKSIGMIELSHLAIPETVKVSVLGQEITPIAFDYHGWPIFSHEQAWQFKTKRLFLDEMFNIKLFAEVNYEERNFEIPKEEFDSVEGIKRAMESLSSLIECINNRSLYYEYNKGKLKEFVIYDEYFLDEKGKCGNIKNKQSSSSNIVEVFDDFVKRNPNCEIWIGLGGENKKIPHYEGKCLYCGRDFKVEDLIENPIILNDGRYYHSSCLETYNELKEVDKLMDEILKARFLSE